MRLSTAAICRINTGMTSGLSTAILRVRICTSASHTGVTEFGHLSIFSDFNNLQDISLDGQYSGIYGVTTDELHQCFHPGVKELARDWEITTDKAYGKLKQSYDGYHFSAKRREDVNNLFSLLNCLSKRMFGDYWFQTGTPTLLTKMIRDMGLPLQDLSQHQTYLTSLTDVSFDLGDPITVLYQRDILQSRIPTPNSRPSSPSGSPTPRSRMAFSTSYSHSTHH